MTDKENENESENTNPTDIKACNDEQQLWWKYKTRKLIQYQYQQ